MRRFSSALFPLLLIGLLAALTFWLERAANPDTPVHKASKRHDPDYIIGHIDARTFDASGALKQSIVATQLTHYPDDDSTIATAPKLTYHSGEKHERITEAIADTAHVSHDNKKVLLNGSVQLIKPPLDGIAATVLKTEALTVYPDDEVAEGVKRVTITRGQSVVSGDRIYYNGKSSITVLAGQVKGTFHRIKKS